MPYNALEKRLQYGRHVLRTCTPFKLMLTDPEARRGALIPALATHYACIYSGEGMPTGGFVYSKEKDDGGHRVVAINATGMEHRRHSLAFGEPITLEENDMAEVEEAASKVTIQSLWDQGARKYAWIGPGKRWPRGGFAYMFEEDAMNCMFPMLGSGERMDRTIMATSVKSRMLHAEPTSEEVQQWLKSESEQRLKWVRLPRCDRARMRSPEVTIARMGARGLLHPLVLHALWITPRRRLLCSAASRAIVQAAFERLTKYVGADIVLQSASLLGVSWLAKYTRSGDFEREVFQSTGVTAAALVIAFVCSRDTLIAICTFVGYWRRQWRWSYLARSRLFIVHLATHLILMIWMFACHLGHEVANAISGRPDGLYCVVEVDVDLPELGDLQARIPHLARRGGSLGGGRLHTHHVVLRTILRPCRVLPFAPRHRLSGYLVQSIPPRRLGRLRRAR